MDGQKDNHFEKGLWVEKKKVTPQIPLTLWFHVYTLKTKGKQQ